MVFLPDGFLFKLINLNLIWKETRRAEHEYINMHPPPPPQLTFLRRPCCCKLDLLLNLRLKITYPNNLRIWGKLMFVYNLLRIYFRVHIFANPCFARCHICSKSLLNSEFANWIHRFQIFCKFFNEFVTEKYIREHIGKLKANLCKPNLL